MKRLSILLMCVPLGWPGTAFAFDWVQYIDTAGTQYAPDVANIGLGTIQAITQETAASGNASVLLSSSLATKLTGFSWAVNGISFVPDTIARREAFNLNWTAAIGQQGLIDASNFVVSKSLGAGLTACFASASCEPTFDLP